MIQATDETRLIRLHRKAVKKLEHLLIACNDEIDSMKFNFDMEHPAAGALATRIKTAINALEGKEVYKL